MRVLLLGATGNVGSRLLPALVVYKHEVVVYVRNPSKLPQEATSLATAVVSGSGTDSEAIKTAILTHKCDALINAAGLAPMWGESGELPAIFAAVTKAATEAHEQRGGPPLRVWLLSGFGILDAPTKGKMLINLYVQSLLQTVTSTDKLPASQCIPSTATTTPSSVRFPPINWHGRSSAPTVCLRDRKLSATPLSLA